MSATGIDDRWRRDAHVRALAKGGFGSIAIGRQVGLSPRHVRRILARSR